MTVVVGRTGMVIDRDLGAFRATVAWSVAVGAAALLASALVASQQSERIATFHQREIERSARALVEAITERFGRIQYGLRGMRGAAVAAGADTVTQRALRAYSDTRDLAEEFPGALGFGVIRRVPRELEGELVARTRAEGRADFAVRQLVAHQGERWVIVSIEPIERNAPALGLDISSEPVRCAAATEAMATGRATLTAPITLMQALSQPESGFLALLPIYRPGEPLATVAQREAAAVGWSYAPVIARDVLATVARPSDLAISLFDISEPMLPLQIHRETVTGSVFTAIERREVLGRRWQIEVVRAAATATSPLLGAGAVFGLGSTASLLLAGLTAAATMGRARRREAARARSRLATIVDSSPDAIVGQDLGGRVVLWNAAAERMFGFRTDEVLRRPVAELLLPDDRLDEDAALRARVVRDGLAPAFDTKRRHRDGRVIEVAVSGAAIRDHTGAVTGTAKVIRDITDHKRYEQELSDLHGSLARRLLELREAQHLLEERTREAERASLAKGEFLATVSHEIRTPLNAILGMHHLLEGTPLDADQRDMVWKAELAGRALLGIVNNVLDLAKIEAGELALHREPFSLRELLREVATVFEAEARSKQLALELELAEELPAVASGDPVRVRQIVTNLVGNALKFTHRGGVQIRAAVETRAGGVARVRIGVRDSGIGIAADVVPTLFAPFVQADASTSRRYGGTGLGLSIVRRLAGLMGGEAGVHSEVGVGSEFWVVVPLSLSDERDRSADPPQIEILVVDDHVPDALALAAIGRSLGWHVTTARSAHEALAQLTDRLQRGGSLPDALVVDWQMPEVDGLQLIEQLSTQLGARMPTALVVSAYERAHVGARAAGLSPDEVLEKPVSVSSLFNAVNRGIARRRGHTADVVRSTRFRDRATRWLPGVRVLAVDDYAVNLEIARRVLQQAGARVEVCSSGEAALELLRARRDAFEVVLMDVQMTGLDGLVTTRRLREELGLTELPVIAVTAGALVEERRRALAAGMNDVVTKPFDPEVLVRVVRRWVESRRREALAVKHVTGPVPRPAATSSAVPPFTGANAAEVAESLELSTPTYLGLMRGLVREFADLATASVAAPGPAEQAALAARLHRLAGGAGQLGAGAVREAALAVEGALRDGLAPPPAELWGALASALDALAGLCAAAPTGEEPARTAVADGSSAYAPLTAEERATLLRLLDEHNLEALDQLEALAPRLRAALGAGFDGLSRATEALDFAKAAEILREIAS